MLAREAPQIGDETPDLFVRQLPAESYHAGTDRSVLDHPEDFAFRPMAPESMVVKIARGWIQLGSQRPITISVFSMTVEAAALAGIERFALLDDLGGTRQRAYECTRLGHFVGRHQRLHHVPFGGPGRDGKSNYQD
jgi:hypothetical protein